MTEAKKGIGFKINEKLIELMMADSKEKIKRHLNQDRRAKVLKMITASLLKTH